MRDLLEPHVAQGQRLASTARPLIVDSFAGGGGASTGIARALGRAPDIAINHNPEALALHAANHPDTLHLSENVYRIDPLTHLEGRHIGLMWFSPDCKHFSKAKGGRPVQRNIRDLAWIIPGWIERIQKSGGLVDVVLLENVEEFKTWGPLIETPKGLMPDPSRAGETFQAWRKKLRRLGGRIESRELRACDYGAPTIRKRLFVVVRFDGKKIVWPAPTHGNPASPEVKAGKLLPWRTAAECIDWSTPCPSIFDSKAEIKASLGISAVRPLKPNTLARVARGIHRYVLQAEQPFIVNLTHGRRNESLAEPFRTITGAHRGEKVLVAPSIIVCGVRAGQSRPRGGDETLATVTAKADACLIAASMVQVGYGERPGQQPRALDIGQPLGTAVASGIKHYPVAALLAQQNNDSRRAGGVNPGRAADAPMSTICQTGSHQNLTAAFLAKYYGTGDGARHDEPAHTVTVRDRFAHIQADLAAPPFGPEHEAKARQAAQLLREHGLWDEREFVTLTIGGAEFVIVDVGMRMLTPREMFRAQGFPDDYIIEGVWEGLDSDDPQFRAFPKHVQVSCCGNSVCPPLAEALVRANFPERPFRGTTRQTSREKTP